MWWAEGDKIVGDEFRGGNVPLRKGVLELIKKGIGGLPGGVEEVWIRADSAFYDHNFLNWARDGFRGEIRIKEIYFAISSVMSEELKERIEELREGEWKRKGWNGQR